MTSQNDKQTKYKALKAIELSDTNFLFDLGPEHICTGFMFDPDVFRHKLPAGTLGPLTVEGLEMSEPDIITEAKKQIETSTADGTPGSAAGLMGGSSAFQAAEAVSKAAKKYTDTSKASPRLTKESPKKKRITKKSATRKKGKNPRKNY